MTIIINRHKTINIALIIIAIISLCLVGYLYYRLNNLEKISKSTIDQEAEDLISKVSNLYLMPTNENPTIATVSDPSLLKDQSFFYSSRKDDKVLIFAKAGKAVLYRPDINKIIEITSIVNKNILSQPNSTSGPIKDETF